MTHYDPKQYGFEPRTRGGHEARIYAVDALGAYPIHSAVKKDGAWFPTSHTNEGRLHSNDVIKHPDDLIPVAPERRTAWVNLYETTLTTREAADELAVPGRIACKQIEYFIGEGLEK